MDTARRTRPSRRSVNAAYSRSSIDVPWRGIPGPVWTMAVGALLYAGLAVIAVVARGGDHSTDGAYLASAVYSLLAAVVLITLKGRTPLWLLQAQIFIVIIFTDYLVVIAPTTVAAVNVSFRYVAIALYVACWMSWRMTTVAISIVTGTSVVAYWLRADDSTNLIVTWLLVTVITWVLAVLLSYLTRAIARHATVDPLTGMLNRAALATLIELSQEPGRVILPRTLVVIDLDDFKSLNDTHGHLAGDRALTELGASWRRTLRADDIAVRSGGDEFLLILPKTNIAEARALLARLQAASPVPWTYGVADWPAEVGFDVVMARADAALYRHKRGELA